MKKLTSITIILLSIFAFNATAHAQYAQQAYDEVTQSKHNAIGVGVSKATKGGAVYSINLGLKYFYASFGSNLKYGEGEELDFQSSKTYKVDKINTVVFNIGPRIFLKSFRIVPYIGLAVTSNIYQDPIAFDSYYMDDAESQFKYGGKLQYAAGKVLISAGAGSFEQINLSIGYRF